MIALFAIYLATALLALWLAHRLVIQISRLAASVLALLPVLLTSPAILTGGHFGGINIAYDHPPYAYRKGNLPEPRYQNGILYDLPTQMLPWRAAVKEAIEAGRLPLWNRFSGAGEPLLASSQSAVLSPNTLLGLALPIATGATLFSALNFLWAALFTFLYLRELDLEEPIALFSSAAFATSLFLCMWNGYPIGTVFASLPLLLLGLTRLAREGVRGFSITVLASFLALVGGHAESALHVAAAAGIVFLGELIGRPRPLAKIAKALAAGLLAFGLSAPVVLPLIEAIPQTASHFLRKALYANATKWLPLKEALRAMAGAVYPATYGRPWAGEGTAPPYFDGPMVAFAGGLTLALAIFGCFGRRRERWAMAAAGFLALSVAAGLSPFANLVSKLPLFDIAINERLGGVAAFFVATLGGLGLKAVLPRFGKREALAAGAILVALLVGGLVSRSWGASTGLASAAPGRSLVILLASCGLFFAILSIVSFRRPAGELSSTQRTALAWCAVGILLASQFLDRPALYRSFDAGLVFPETQELAVLPKGPAPFRTVGLGHTMIPNQSVLLGVEDPRSYNPLDFRRLADTLPLWTAPEGYWLHRIDDATDPFLSFLNVRFALGEPAQAAPPGWKDVTRGLNISVFFNPGALPRAFTPKRVRLTTDAARTIDGMKARPDFAEVAWIDAVPEGEMKNGPAEVSTASDGPDLVLTIEAAADSWIVVSETAWRGWRVEEGKERHPIHFANHAFVGFRVPAGRHVVRMTYWPESLSWGLGLCAATILIRVLAAVLRRRRGVQASPVSA